MKTKLLQAADIERLVQQIGLDALMDGLISRLTDTFQTFDPLNANIPIRDGLQYYNPSIGMLEWMPALLNNRDISIKLVGYHPANPDQRGLPSVLSTITLFDGQSGHLKGIVDGTFLTAMRTGAMSAVASRVLARPDSSVVGVIGAGAQSVTQIYALSRLFPVRKVICYDAQAQAAQSLQERIGFIGIPVEPLERETLPHLLDACDIICTCTSEEPGNDPVFEDFNNSSHLHINAVGSDFHGKTEVPVGLLKRATVCPDFRDQAIYEGECQLLEENEIGPDIVDLVKNCSAYAYMRETPTVFDSTGWALADFVVGNLVLELADQTGVGSNVELECIPRDPRNPLSFMKTAVPKSKPIGQAPAPLTRKPF